MLMITGRVPVFFAPVVILRGRKLSFKQLANGTVLIGGGHQGRCDRDANTTQIDWHRLAESAHTVWELFPAMHGAQIVRAWAGIEAGMPDGIPVIGPSTKAEGVYHQFGFCGHGFQLAPGVGALMAELIATGKTDLPISPFNIARFARLGAARGRLPRLEEPPVEPQQPRGVTGCSLAIATSAQGNLGMPRQRLAGFGSFGVRGAAWWQIPPQLV
jgi:sarcosine oxidase subunit beta